MIILGIIKPGSNLILTKTTQTNATRACDYINLT